MYILFENRRQRSTPFAFCLNRWLRFEWPVIVCMDSTQKERNQRCKHTINHHNGEPNLELSRAKKLVPIWFMYSMCQVDHQVPDRLDEKSAHRTRRKKMCRQTIRSIFWSSVFLPTFMWIYNIKNIFTM